MMLMVCVEVVIFHGRKKKEFATINIGKGEADPFHLDIFPKGTIGNF